MEKKDFESLKSNKPPLANTAVYSSKPKQVDTACFPSQTSNGFKKAVDADVAKQHLLKSQKQVEKPKDIYSDIAEPHRIMRPLTHKNSEENFIAVSKPLTHGGFIKTHSSSNLSSRLS